MTNDPNRPVYIYVGAWLLPLASFVLLVLGGKRWGRAGAFVALAAIVGSFGLSTYGLIRYTSDFSPNFYPDSHSESGHDGSGHDAGEPHESHGALPSRIGPFALLNVREIEYEEREESAEPRQSQSSTGVLQDGPVQKKDQDEPVQMIPMPAPGPSPIGGPPRDPNAPIPVIKLPAPKLEPGVWKTSFDWITVSAMKIRIGFYVDS